MARWPKDTPGTWYSRYKRGSLVSGTPRPGALFGLGPPALHVIGTCFCLPGACNMTVIQLRCAFLKLMETVEMCREQNSPLPFQETLRGSIGVGEFCRFRFRVTYSYDSLVHNVVPHTIFMLFLFVSCNGKVALICSCSTIIPLSEKVYLKVT